MNKIILNRSGVKITNEIDLIQECRGTRLDSGSDEDTRDPYMFWPKYGPAFILYGIIDKDNAYFIPLK